MCGWGNRYACSRRSFLAGGLGFGLGLLMGGCGVPGAGMPRPRATPARTMMPVVAPPFDGERAYQELVRQVEFGPRVSGMSGHLACRDWLRAQLADPLGRARLQPFRLSEGQLSLSMYNVLADHDPENERQVLLCAHWDTRPTADEEEDPARRKLPIPGANDGASGVSVILEIARAVAAHPPGVGVRFVLFDGEDYGPGNDRMYLGAKHYAANPPALYPEWGVLLDMVGDLNLDIWREKHSEAAAPQVNDRLWAAAGEAGHRGIFHDAEKWAITDDHLPLLEAGIPVVDLIDFDYQWWHTLDDSPDKCSSASLGRVGEPLLHALYRYAAEGESGAL